MLKEELYKLLEEAGKKETDYSRQTAIFQQLTKALIDNANHSFFDDYSDNAPCFSPKSRISNCQNCLLSLLHRLYWGCLEQAPNKLVNLFPVFQSLCGDLPTLDSLNRLAIIDWSWWLNKVSQKS